MAASATVISSLSPYHACHTQCKAKESTTWMARFEIPSNCNRSNKYFVKNVFFFCKKELEYETTEKKF